VRLKHLRFPLAVAVTFVMLAAAVSVSLADDPDGPTKVYFPWVAKGAVIEDHHSGPNAIGPIWGTVRITNLEDETIEFLAEWTAGWGDLMLIAWQPIEPYASVTFEVGQVVQYPPGSGLVVTARKQGDQSPARIAAVVKQTAPVPTTDGGQTSQEHMTVGGYTGLTAEDLGSEILLPIVQTNNNWNTVIRATNFAEDAQTTVSLMLYPAGGGAELGPFNENALGGETASFNLAELGVPDGWVGYAQLNAATPIAAIAERVKTETHMMIINTSRRSQPETSEQFAPLIFRDWFDWNTGISLVNLVPLENAITIRYYAPDGSEVHFDQLVLQPNAMDFRHFPAGEGGVSFVGSAVVESMFPIHGVVDEVKYLGDFGDTGHAMSYMIEPDYARGGQKLTMPLYQKGDPHSGDSSGIQVFNPTNASVSFSAIAHAADGTSYPLFGAPVALEPKAGMTIYSLDLPELSHGFNGSVTISLSGVQGGLVGVSNNVNYDVEYDGSASFNMVLHGTPNELAPPPVITLSVD
jgi:hypothetical protein